MVDDQIGLVVESGSRSADDDASHDRAHHGAVVTQRPYEGDALVLDHACVVDPHAHDIEIVHLDA